MLEVYVPLRLKAGGEPAGVLEIYLDYAPTAAAIHDDTRTLYLLLLRRLRRALALALLDRAGRLAQAPPPGHARHAHRVAQPHEPVPADGPRDRQRARVRRARRPAADRPRPLQGGQRHARARSRRHAAARGRRAAGRRAAPRRHAGAARRRRVRRAAARSPRPRLRRGARPAPADGARAAVRRPRRDGAARGQHRHRAVPGPRHRRHDAPPARRRGDVRGQAGAGAHPPLRRRAGPVLPGAARAARRAARRARRAASSSCTTSRRSRSPTAG